MFPGINAFFAVEPTELSRVMIFAAVGSYILVSYEWLSLTRKNICNLIDWEENKIHLWYSKTWILLSKATSIPLNCKKVVFSNKSIKLFSNFWMFPQKKKTFAASKYLEEWRGLLRYLCFKCFF